MSRESITVELFSGESVQFEIDTLSDCIVSPGRYEAETLATPILDDLIMLGEGDLIETNENWGESLTFISIGSQACALRQKLTPLGLSYPPEIVGFFIWKESAGFVGSREVTQDELNEALAC